MNYRPWTEEEKAEVRRRLQANESLRKACAAIGRSDKNALRELNNEAPAPKPKESTFTPIPDFDKEHAQWMKEVQAAQERRQRQYEGRVV